MSGVARRNPVGAAKTRRSYDLTSVCWARDLLQTGSGWLETSKKTGVPETTLQDIAKRENWFIAIQDRKKGLKIVRSIIGTPPKKTPATTQTATADIPTPRRSVSCQINGISDSDISTPGGLPPKFSKIDPIKYIIDTVLWAIDGISAAAGSEIARRCWLVEKMPPVVTMLLAVEASGRNKKDDTGDTKTMLEQVNERLLAIQAPPLVAADHGETPKKESLSKKKIAAVDECETIEPIIPVVEPIAVPVVDVKEPVIETALASAADQIDEMLKNLGKNI